MKEELEKIRADALGRIEGCGELSLLTQIEVEYLGRKGAITGLLRRTGSLLPEERPAFGKRANELKAEIQQAIDARRAIFEREERENKLRNESVDVTLPGIKPEVGPRGRSFQSWRPATAGGSVIVAEQPCLRVEG